MAFKEKVDPFDLETTGLVVKSTEDGASASVAEAMDEDGTIVANTVYGETLAPSADYVVTGSPTISGVKLGAVSTYKTKRVVLTNLTVNTSAGGEPTVSASGEQVEDADTGTCPAKYSVPSFSLGPCHHAKTLFDAFTVGGQGCYLQSANYTASCENGTATKDGEVMAHGVYGAKIECQVEIIQTGAAAPTLTVGTGWVITSPLSETNPDAEYPTYSATLTKYLTKDASASS